ncbi:hypothetical protein NEOLEDRAFT_1135871 [Neolentinus lepideus HHB14362 ss-1]|uniref:Uncharacterized protein n=1 Tax=Neolentinus lepideus HHB14362 ss-1 TaxID=1314782 RepID=A0A165RG65_9AGAM|nr:hypothetical protein NEOLEDRAFT_1135871 [Neolentinus lepideus HHB14362 ss-1]
MRPIWRLGFSVIFLAGICGSSCTTFHGVGANASMDSIGSDRLYALNTVTAQWDMA